MFQKDCHKRLLNDKEKSVLAEKTPSLLTRINPTPSLLALLVKRKVLSDAEGTDIRVKLM